jgi:DNA-binding response OmpR family regulator
MTICPATPCDEPGRPYRRPVTTVAFVEDDPAIASVVVSYLRRAGHEVAYASDGPGGLALVARSDPDLVLLDVMLPGMDGIEVCRRVRAASPHLPIVMLTALGEVDDRIAGLEVGADDYVTKPFSPRELMLRIESVLRRSMNAPDRTQRLRAGDLEVDPAARQATRGGCALSLTSREFDLLVFLMAHPGVAFSREQLLHRVWGWTFGDQSTVTVHIRRLREKVEADPTHPSLIQTVFGVGYRLDPAVTEATV